MSEHIAHIRMNGRLGNQLFQFLFGHALASRTGWCVRFDTSEYQVHRDLEAGVDQELNFRPLVPDPVIEASRFDSSPFPLTRRGHFFQGLCLRLGYAPPLDSTLVKTMVSYQDYAVLEPPGRPITAEQLERMIALAGVVPRSFWRGFWQSMHCLPDPATCRTLLVDPDPAASPWIGRIQEMDGSVGIHIRRGDYLRSLLWAREYRPQGLAYVQSLIEAFRRRLDRPRIFIFSNDTEWCRALLADEDVEICDEPDPRQALQAMRVCRHFAVSNSSLSWLAAYTAVTPVESRMVLAPIWWSQDHTTRSLALLPSGWLDV